MKKENRKKNERWNENEELVLLSEKGSAPAQNILAARLAQGYFVEVNLEGAIYWYVQAATQGYTPAKFNLGTMLVHGEGIGIKNISKGIFLIEQAAECGDPGACSFLSECYSYGLYGKVPDSSVAAEWNERAMDDSNFIEYGVSIEINEQELGAKLNKPVIVKK